MKNKKETEDRKTVLMLSWEYPPHIVGGLARHVHALSVELVKMNYDIHVITARAFDSASYEKRDGIHIHRVSPLNQNDPDFLAWIGGLNLAAVDEALAIADHIEVDAVHTHDWLTGPAAEFISQSLSIPLIATIHGTEFGRNKGIYTELQQFVFSKEKNLAHLADEIIVCSNYMEAEVARLFEVSKEKISVITNGAEADNRSIPDLRIEEAYPFLKGRKVVFSIGRMVEEKGFGTLIRSALALKTSCPELCFVIAGNGPLLEIYRQKVKRLGLTDTVYFIGFINDVIRKGLLQRADIAVFASSYEPFGLAAAEALAAGVPTVVAETGGLKSLVENLETGFYMKPDDEKSLTDTINYIIKNDQLARAIATKGKLAVNAKFSWEQNAKATDNLYINSLNLYSSQKEGMQ